MNIDGRLRQAERAAVASGRIHRPEIGVRTAGDRDALAAEMLTKMFHGLEARRPGLAAKILQAAESGLRIPPELGILGSMIAGARNNLDVARRVFAAMD